MKAWGYAARLTVTVGRAVNVVPYGSGHEDVARRVCILTFLKNFVHLSKLDKKEYMFITILFGSVEERL